MSQEVRAKITNVLYKIDINTLHRDVENTELAMNDIARVSIKTASPILADPYRTNRITGAFILVDPSTHATVAAGVIG
jgi:sulfate adenylyltransferase subunit 1